MSPALSRRGRREELLDAADRVVRRDGHRATMAAIAGEAGISKPILYRHFGDRDGLYSALAERHTARLLTRLAAAVRAGRTPRGRIRGAVDTYLRLLEAEPQVYRLLVHADEGAAARAEVRRFLRALGDLLGRGVVEATGARTVRQVERAELWAHGVVGLVQAAGDWWLEHPSCPRARLTGEVTELAWGSYRPLLPD